MSSTMARTEEKIFHVSKNGTSKSDGPYSKKELEDLLANGKIEAEDYVFFPGLVDWKVIGEVFDFRKGPSDLVEDGQDLDTVTECFKIITDQNRAKEEIQYVAIQHLAPYDRLSEILQEMPQSLVLTNQRLAVITPVLIGDPKIVNYPLNEVVNLSSQLNRRDGGTLFNIEMSSGDSTDITSVPDQQIFNLIETSREFLG